MTKVLNLDVVGVLVLQLRHRASLFLSLLSPNGGHRARVAWLGLEIEQWPEFCGVRKMLPP